MDARFLSFARSGVPSKRVKRRIGTYAEKKKANGAKHEIERKYAFDVRRCLLASLNRYDIRVHARIIAERTKGRNVATWLHGERSEQLVRKAVAWLWRNLSRPLPLSSPP